MTDYPMKCKWCRTPDGSVVEIDAETLPGWIAYAMATDPDFVYLEAGRAICDCHGLCYWTQPYANHAQMLIKQWTAEARVDPDWIRAWIQWFVSWAAEIQAKVKADTGLAFGEDPQTPGYRRPA